MVQPPKIFVGATVKMDKQGIYKLTYLDAENNFTLEEFGTGEIVESNLAKHNLTLANQG